MATDPFEAECAALIDTAVERLRRRESARDPMAPPRLCKHCGERRVPKWAFARHSYICSRCFEKTPSRIRYRQSAKFKAAQAKYDQSPRGQARHANGRQRQIRIGDEYHSMAPTAEIARAVTAHIKERRSVFKQRQQDRKEAESTTES